MILRRNNKCMVWTNFLPIWNEVMMKSPTFGRGASQKPWFRISSSVSCSLISPSFTSGTKWLAIQNTGFTFSRSPLLDDMTTLSRLESWLAVTLCCMMTVKHCSPPSGLYCCPVYLSMQNSGCCQNLPRPHFLGVCSWCHDVHFICMFQVSMYKIAWLVVE